MWPPLRMAEVEAGIGVASKNRAASGCRREPRFAILASGDVHPASTVGDDDPAMTANVRCRDARDVHVGSRADARPHCFCGPGGVATGRPQPECTVPGGGITARSRRSSPNRERGMLEQSPSSRHGRARGGTMSSGTTSPCRGGAGVVAGPRGPVAEARREPAVRAGVIGDWIQRGILTLGPSGSRSGRRDRPVPSEMRDVWSERVERVLQASGRPEACSSGGRSSDRRRPQGWQLAVTTRTGVGAVGRQRLVPTTGLPR